MKRTSASPADNLSPLGDAVLVSDVAETAADDRNLVVLRDPDELPPILAGHLTPQLRARAESFFAGVAELFERWVARRPSHHTQRAYRRDILSFVRLSRPQLAPGCLQAAAGLGRRRAALA